MIYTGKSFWNQYMNDQFGSYPLWIAEYGVAQPILPKGWDAWTFWQSSQTGSVAGVAGNVDLDCFAGSYQDLLALLQAPAATSATAATSTNTANGANAQTYAVQPGNTLSDIAAQFGVSVAQLAAANNIQNPNVISVGQVLTIPAC